MSVPHLWWMIYGSVSTSVEKNVDQKCTPRDIYKASSGTHTHLSAVHLSSLNKSYSPMLFGDLNSHVTHVSHACTNMPKSQLHLVRREWSLNYSLVCFVVRYKNWPKKKQGNPCFSIPLVSSSPPCWSLLLLPNLKIIMTSIMRWDKHDREIISTTTEHWSALQW